MADLTDDQLLKVFNDPRTTREHLAMLTPDELSRLHTLTASPDTAKPGTQDTIGDVQHEPDTFRGGFAKGLKREFDATSAPGAEGMAHPKTLGDFTSLLIPSELGMGRGGMSTLSEFADRSKQAMKAAGAETKGIRGVASFPFRAVGKFNEALPSNMEKASAKFTGVNTPATAPTASTGSETSDAWDRWGRDVKDTPNVKPPTRKTPTLDEELQNSLEEIMKSREQPTTVTGAPSELTEAGSPQLRTGKKNKPIGYESANPQRPKDEAQYQSIMERLGKKPIPDAEMATPVGPGPVVDKPKLSVAEVAQKLRGQYGSRDAGSMLYGPSLSPADRAAAIRRLAPGPSRIPTSAQERIDAAMHSAAGGGEDDPILKLLMAGIGGGLVASHGVGGSQ